MKKNVMMRIASILLVCVLATTCGISGTFAKYVTSETAGDTARVAKWGVFFDLEGGPLFSTQYKTDDKANYATMDLSVQSNENVVAPGTSGELVKFRTTGTPEVSYVVTFEVDATTLKTIFTNKYVTYDAYRNPTATDITGGYYPIVFTLDLNGTKTTYTDIQKLAQAINEYTYYFNVDDGMYYVNGAAQATIPTLTLNWEWDFDNSGLGTYDVYDTTLGNLMADVPGVKTAVGDGNYNLKIVIDITATATQID